MKNFRFVYPLLSIFFGLFVFGALFIQPLIVHSIVDSETAVSPAPVSQNQKLNDALQDQLSEAEPDEHIRYIVYMHESVNIKQLAQHIEDTDLRHSILVESLQQTAAQSQKTLLNDLDSLQQTGDIQSYRSFWIINAVAIQGTPSSIAQLANRSDIASITLDESRPLISPPDLAKQIDFMWQTAALAAAGEEAWGIERVNAAHAWHGLGIDGSGITVGIMDSGVDWQHSDLLPNYRGNLGGGSYVHTGNWYDAVVPTMTIPHDVMGHGTHVAGTAVGQNGIGVAPGASWIAVNIADTYGFIYNSDVHNAFQWLLAPNGDPALAPDVINGSWSGPGYLTEFEPDIQALDAAGIFTVFSAGNNGPWEESIGSPASLTETLAIGAHDKNNELAWFSSRGPSPLHNEFHPQIIAPGTSIYSSLPDNQYGYYNGTSMSAPHTTGAVALLLSANNALSRPQITQILTETAVPISTTHPNMNSGWGRLDAYQAVAQVTGFGTLTGIVHESGQPLSGIVVTVTTGSGDELPYVTDENGRYTAKLQPGTYDLSTSPFGFVPAAINDLVVTVNQTTNQNMALNRLPSGTLTIQVDEIGTHQPLQAEIDILDIPTTLETDGTGSASIILPVGTYDVRVRKTGYQVALVQVSISLNQTTARTINLSPTKKVLLVDSGGWYYNSYQEYFSSSLLDLGYAHDSHIVINPALPDLPDQEEINDYDVLIWSAPSDSPGYIGANNVITDFLGQGGSMMLSGQDIGYYDGSGFGTQIWWYRDLQAQFMGETAVTHTITGASDTNYAGMSFTLNGSDSAENQTLMDVSRPRTGALSQEIFYAESELAVGLQAGHCKPFRLNYLGFGLEGVTDENQRNEILTQSFNYFDTPRQETGFAWSPSEIDELAPPGNELVYPVQIQHLGELITDTYTLFIENSEWPISLSQNAVELGPCTNDLVTVTVQIPDNLPRNIEHDFNLTAVSQHDPAVSVSLPFHHKTPDHILLVDDDRWYDQEEIYRAALIQAGFSFDEWNIGWDENVKGSPSLSLLNAYDFVVWYTGYDWFAPITDKETETLSAYLSHGGRLFLSSQDFLYYNHKTKLAQNQLGIIEYHESVTPTVIYRGHASVPPNLPEPLPITYGKFQNNGDRVTPNSSAAAFLWHERGLGSVANSIYAPEATTKPEFARTIFLGFPFEKLPIESHAPLMNSFISWLSDIGDSSFVVDQRSGSTTATRTFTITLQNHVYADSSMVIVTNTLPVSLALQPASLTGATYDLGTRQVRWQGELNSGENHIISYQAVPSPVFPPGTRIDNLVTWGLPQKHLQFNHTASFWVNTSDLSGSKLTAMSSTQGQSQFITYTATLENIGLQATDHVSATLLIPESLTITNFIAQPASGTLTQTETGILWTGQLEPSEMVTVTVATTREMAVDVPEWLTAVSYLEDGMTNPIVQLVTTYLPPHKTYMPIIAIND